MKKTISLTLPLFFLTACSAVTQPTQHALLKPAHFNKIAHTAYGHCISSIASSRNDARRCFANSGAIYDPCFVLHSNQLICPDSPWSKKATRFIAQKVQKSAQKILYRADTPWSIELVDGTKCSLMTGGTGAIKGKRISYACSNKDYLLDMPRTQLWQMSIFSYSHHSKRIKKAIIKKVYY